MGDGTVQFDIETTIPEGENAQELGIVEALPKEAIKKAFIDDFIELQKALERVGLELSYTVKGDGITNDYEANGVIKPIDRSVSEKEAFNRELMGKEDYRALDDEGRLLKDFDIGFQMWVPEQKVPDFLDAVRDMIQSCGESRGR